MMIGERRVHFSRSIRPWTESEHIAKIAETVSISRLK